MGDSGGSLTFETRCELVEMRGASGLRGSTGPTGSSAYFISRLVSQRHSAFSFIVNLAGAIARVLGRPVAQQSTELLHIRFNVNQVCFSI